MKEVDKGKQGERPKEEKGWPTKERNPSKNEGD